MHSFTFSLSFNIFFLLLFLNNNFATFRILGWQLWFSAHWMCSLTDVWHPLFLMRICLFILVEFPVSNELFSSYCFQDFSPCLWLSPFLLWLVCLWISLHLFFEFAELHGCVTFSNIFCEFSAAISSYFFCSYLSSPSAIHFVCIDVLSNVSYSSEYLVFFILFFFLLFRLYNAYQFIFSFANYFFCFLKSAVEPLKWNFHWKFQLQNFHVVPFSSFIALWYFVFVATLPLCLSLPL